MLELIHFTYILLWHSTLADVVRKLRKVVKNDKPLLTHLKWLGWYSWVNPLLLWLPTFASMVKDVGTCICMVVEGCAWPGTHPLIGCCWTPLCMSIVGRVFHQNLTPPMELWSGFTSKGAQHYPYTVLLPTFDYPHEPKNDCNVCLIFCNIMVVNA